MYFLLKLIINTVALLLVVHFIPGMSVADWKTAVLAALALGVVNAVIRPVVIFLTLPLNILTLGFLTFVINAALFYSVSAFVPGFRVSGFSAAFFGSLLFSIVSAVLSFLLTPSPRVHFYGRDRDRARYRDAIDVEGKREDEER